jgi:hypothetical protein
MRLGNRRFGNGLDNDHGWSGHGHAPSICQGDLTAKPGAVPLVDRHGLRLFYAAVQYFGVSI